MSDRDNRYKEEPMMAGCSSNLCDQDDDTGEANNNQINCAPSSLLRRSHRIGPLRTMKNNASEEQLSTRSPIRIQFRPNPGRSFDGFLDRFTKSKSLLGPLFICTFTEDFVINIFFQEEEVEVPKRSNRRCCINGI